MCILRFNQEQTFNREDHGVDKQSAIWGVCVCVGAECEVSEDSSGEVELEPEASDPEDVRELHPGALLYKACQTRNLPVMAEALAHGADVNSVNEEDEGKSPLIQAVIGVSQSFC